MTAGAGGREASRFLPPTPSPSRQQEGDAADTSGRPARAGLTVAFAIRNQEFLGDRIFDLLPDGPVDQAPYTPWRRVRELARERGLKLVTGDRVLNGEYAASSALLLAYDWTPLSAALVEAGTRPAALVSFEPPIIAWELYYKLRRISAQFPHTFLFAGGSGRVSPRTRFHPLAFPQVREPGEDSGAPWEERRFLVMMGGNKGLVRNPVRFFDRPREFSLRREVATRRYPALGDELYTERLRAIEHFADSPDFDLYGHGWGQRHPTVGEREHRQAMRAYRGPAPHKLQTLGQYRFAFAHENSQFPGYISEKLFDCFFAGCVPLYLGAPDIERHVPRETFVDPRAFRDYAELELFLRSMRAARAREYLEAARAFLHSAAYQRFTREAFAQEMVDALAACARSIPAQAPLLQ